MPRGTRRTSDVSLAGTDMLLRRRQGTGDQPRGAQDREPELRFRVNAGGNDVQIQGVSFTIDKPDDLQRQAREQAIADARDKADTLAKASGVSLGDAISISEGGGVQPVPATAAFDRAAGAAAPQTPIQPGELDVTVTVNVTWAIK